MRRPRRGWYSDASVVAAVDRANKMRFTSEELYDMARNHRRQGNLAAYDFWMLIGDYIRLEELEP